MSGPKVVRIVTREEVEAICRIAIGQLKAGIENWRRAGLRSNLIGQTEIDAAMDRLATISKLLEMEEYLQLQKQVPSEIAFLEDDLEQRQHERARRELEAKSAKRRQQRAAQQLLSAFDARSRTLPADLKHALECGAEGRKLPQGMDLEVVFGEVFEFLAAAPRAAGSSTDGDRLAEGLSDGDTSSSYEAWLARQERLLEGAGNAESDRKLARADSLVADLEARLPADEAAQFIGRLADIEATPDARRKAMLLDSFVAEAARAAEIASKHARISAQLKTKCAELATIEALASGPLLQRLAAAAEQPEPSTSAGLLAEADAAITAALARMAANARRNAMLEGLAALGYEVNEGLSTALKNNQPVVVKNPMTPGYGVELSTPEGASRCQMRVVAFGSGAAGRDTSRDRDIETMWCSDLDRLRALLVAKGSDFAIERAMPVGAMPLKVVELAEGERSTGEAPIARPRIIGKS